MEKGCQDMNSEQLHKFWNSFNAWVRSNEVLETLFRAEFVQWDSWDGGTFYMVIDFETEYLIQYGKGYPIVDDTIPSKEELFEYIEIMYERWIKNRYEFTVQINQKFKSFDLPFKLDKGKIIILNCKPRYMNDEILDIPMFEQKIKDSEAMINQEELAIKKAALQCIVQALQYYLSIQEGDNIKKKHAKIAKMVSGDENSKVYSVVKNEINEVMKLVNEYFDIRHNECLNNSKEKREALVEPRFIEYLYYRIFVLLQLFRNV